MFPAPMSLWLAILLLVAANVVTVSAMLFVRRRAPAGSYFHDTQQASGVFTVAGTAYAVLLAFVFLLAFQSYNTARNAAEQEATAVTALFHDADAFVPSGRDAIQGELACYARSVIHLEWPAMADGNSSPVTEGWITRFDRTYAGQQPRTPKQQNADANWTPLNIQRQDGHRGRLAEAQPLIPSLVWLLLGVGTVLVIVFVGFFADRRERRVAQALLMVSVTTILCAGLLMIKFFDDPYEDVPGAIQPYAMQRTLTTLTTLRPGRKLRVPCDEQGRPLTRTS